MLRALLFAFAIFCVAIPAHAAVKAATMKKPPDDRFFCWEDVTNADTVRPQPWPGGEGQVWVGGTESTVDFSVTYTPYVNKSLEEIDVDVVSDGIRFTSVATENIAVFKLAEGVFGINFRSAGGSTQDLDVCVSPIYSAP